MAFWQYLSFNKISRLNREILVLIPVGTLEAHGRHLPLNTDTLIPKFLCQEIIKKINSIIAPEISFGICDSMLKFPGTISVRSRTMSLLVSDYLDSIIGYGFKNIYLLNGHGGNEDLLANMVQKYSSKIHIRTKDWYDFDYLRQLKSTDSTYLGDHADRLETEILLHASPKLVKLNSAKNDYFLWPDTDPDEYSKIMPNAVYGYPKSANPASAKKHYNKIVELLIEDINGFLINK